MIDIVGTLSQPNIALCAFLGGQGIGTFFGLCKTFLPTKHKLALILSDFVLSILFGLVYLGFCFYYTKGVAWLYTLLSMVFGYCTSYFPLLAMLAKFKTLFKKLRARFVKQ